MGEGIKEEELYTPVCRFLSSQGYTVRGEVKNCDVAAIRDGEMVVVELKTAFNLKLVYQAMDRKAITENVYAAIPRPKTGQNTRAWKNMLRLLKKLEIGLITVALDGMGSVDVILEPTDGGGYKNSRKRSALAGELAGRHMDANNGGIVRRKIMTAYKEREIALCVLLSDRESITFKELKAMGLGAEYQSVLTRNYSRLFDRKGRGQYALAQKGRELIAEADFKEAVAYYTKEFYAGGAADGV